ncbi:MAG: hypothetical protein HYW47_03525 [Deltaproteobacteria bacterium]|nr:hypothetical protein [Deltaproteobacteria bacterium]
MKKMNPGIQVRDDGSEEVLEVKRYSFYLAFGFLGFLSLVNLSYAEGSTCPPPEENPFKERISEINGYLNKLQEIQTTLAQRTLEEQKELVSESIQNALDCVSHSDVLIEELAQSDQSETNLNTLSKIQITKLQCEEELNTYKNKLKKILIELDIRSYISRRGIPNLKSQNHYSNELDQILFNTLFTKNGIARLSTPQNPQYTDPRSGSSIQVTLPNRKNYEGKTFGEADEIDDTWSPGNDREYTWSGIETQEFYPGMTLENYRNYIKNTNNKDMARQTKDEMEKMFYNRTPIKYKNTDWKDPLTQTEFNSYNAESISRVNRSMVEKTHYHKEEREIYLPEDKTLVTRSYFLKPGSEDKAPTYDNEALTIVQESEKGLLIVNHSRRRGQRYAWASDSVWNPQSYVEAYQNWAIPSRRYF